MQSYPTEWTYGYTTGTTDPYAAYYSEWYKGFQAAPQPSAAPPSAYSSDLAAAIPAYTVPPPTKYNQQRSKPFSNLHEVTVTNQPPPPIKSVPAPVGVVKGTWQQYSQVQAIKNEPQVAPVPQVHSLNLPKNTWQTQGQVANRAKQPQRYAYPIKKFVKPVSNSTEEDETVICQKVREVGLFNKVQVQFENVESISPGLFAVRLTLGQECYTGAGDTFKDAKHIAATKALATTVYNKPPERKTMRARPTGNTATQELFVLASRKGCTPEFKFLEPPNFDNSPRRKRPWVKTEMRGYYKVELKVAGQEFVGQGDLPQSAKHDAANQAIPVLNTLADVANLNPQTPDSNIGLLPNGKHVTMALNEIALLKGVCMEWNMVSEIGPPHQRNYVWSLTMGDHEVQGSGVSKKLAKAYAALNMYNTIPEDWKNITPPVGKKKKGYKRKSDQAGPSSGPLAKQANIQTDKPNPGQTAASGSGSTTGPGSAKPQANAQFAQQVIQATNPISAIYEYCHKAKMTEPNFEVVSETVISVDPRNFKKMEYTMRLTIGGKNYEATAKTKKAAKQAVAALAWDALRMGTI